MADELGTAELAATTARQLTQALHAEWAVVAVTDESDLVLERGFRHGGGAVPEGEAAPLLRFVAGRRQSFVGNDPQAALPAGGPAEGPSLAALGWRNVLAVPSLNHQGRAVAVLLAADRRDGGPFSPADLAIAELLALSAAVGFERSLLLERLTDWSNSLEALLAFSASVNSNLDPPALVRHLVEHAAQFVKASGGRAGLLVDGEPPQLVSDGYWRKGSWIERLERFERGRGLAGFVLDKEFPYLSNDYPRDPQADPELAVAFDVRRALAIPIRGGDHRVLGFFELHRSGTHPPFSWQEAAFLESLANTTAVAIENARLLAALAAKNQEIRNLSAHNVERLEDERRHIARELHDEAGQALVGVKLGLQVMARLVPQELPALRDELDQLRDHVNAATTRIKDLAQRLRPPALDQLGLEVALRQLATEYGVRAGFSHELDVDPLPARLPSMVETALFRIAQEALTNVAAHAGASRVWLRLGQSDQGIALSVADDGRGFDTTASRGLGLLGIQERVDRLGGEFRLRSSPGVGTALAVLLPGGDDGE
jgi:signal transduction histidine kinase